MISATIANRLKPILEKIIGHEQTAYILGRYIAECTRNTYDIFDHARENNLTGMMIMIDFEKAFNSVGFKFIVATLDVWVWGIFHKLDQDYSR